MKPPSQLDFSSPEAREARYGEFVGLLARHDQSIRRFVRSLMPSGDGVDDVIQETALECWKKFESFSPADGNDAGNDFIRWACVIARYKVLSWQRDHFRDRLVFREGVVERLLETVPLNADQRDGERKAFEVCLEKLPENNRRLVLSVHSPGESVAKIASETGVVARRLYSKVNAIRKLLLECVDRQLLEEA